MIGVQGIVEINVRRKLDLCLHLSEADGHTAVIDGEGSGIDRLSVDLNFFYTSVVDEHAASGIERLYPGLNFFDTFVIDDYAVALGVGVSCIEH